MCRVNCSLLTQDNVCFPHTSSEPEWIAILFLIYGNQLSHHGDRFGQDLMVNVKSVSQYHTSQFASRGFTICRIYDTLCP